VIVCGIDPGPEKSAYVLWDGKKICAAGNYDNDVLVRVLTLDELKADYCAIEQVRGFGVMAGNTLFDTCMWSGRIFQAFWVGRAFWVPRKEAAAHICGVGGISKDAFVRQALIDRFGGKEKAIGTKKAPGPLYGITGHVWAALAVALTWWDQNPELRKVFNTYLIC
jgi:hypothetical protein